MSKDTGLDSRLNIRVPGELVKRLDALISKVGRLPRAALAGKVNRSKVAHLALLEGVAVLEAETGSRKPGEGRAR